MVVKMIFQNKKKITFPFIALISLFLSNAYSFHSNNRYFYFSESDYTKPLSKSCCQFNADAIFSSASSAFRKDGLMKGLPELFGEYDLKEVIESLKTVKGAGFVNPIDSVPGSSPLLKDRSIPFNIQEKINAQTVALSYTHWFADKTWFVGAWLPITQVSGVSRYSLKARSFFNVFPAKLTDRQKEKMTYVISKIRRETHEQIGFHDNDWNGSGFGDLDIHAGYRVSMDHQFLMRSINLLPKIGLMIPSGRQRNPDNPSSIPFMGDNHFGTYFQLDSLFELKQNLRVGLLFRGLFQFSKRKRRRIPVFKESALYSSLIGDVNVRPGVTLVASPYLILENLTDGLNFLVRYTYAHHTADSIKDVRYDKTIASYLTMKPSAGITDADVKSNIAAKKDLTKWKSHYVTLQLVYNTDNALANWKAKPTIYVKYDMPFHGSGVSKTRQITAGATFHF